MSSFKLISTSLRGDWLPRIDFVVDYPVEEVWPLIVRWDRWVLDKRVTHIGGEADQLGAIKKVADFKDGVEGAYFILQIVRLIPNVRMVSRTLPIPEPYEGFQVFRGYAIFNLFSLGDRRTLVSYETTCECESSLMTEEKMGTVIGIKAEEDSVPHWEAHYIPALKKLLAEGRPKK